MRRKIFFLVLAILLSSSVSRASTYIVVDEFELQDAVVIVDDLQGQNRNKMLVGQGQSVFLKDGDTKEGIIHDISGQISALALGDVDGDFRNDIVIGTASAGALYIYSENDGVWERQGHPQYLWSTIQHLEIYDFNQDGWGDIVFLTEGGMLQILLSHEGKLYPFWKSPSDQVVNNFQVFDLDLNGFPDLVYTYQSGYVGILTWDDQAFVTLWENYPWGLIESLVVIPQQSEWLVVTSQKMLYGWRYRNGEIISSRHFYASELGEHLFYFPSQGLLSFSRKSGVALFELKTASVTEKWKVSGVYGSHAFEHEGNFFFRDLQGNYHRLVEDSGDWHLFVDNRDISNHVGILEQAGKLYYSLPELAREFGYVVFGLTNWQFIQDGRHFKLFPERNIIEYDNLNIPLTSPVLLVDGKPYAPAELLAFFGWNAEVDFARKHVVFLKSWGWWL